MCETKMIFDRERVDYHEKAMRSLQASIIELERGDIRHYCERLDGRLDLDDTPRMLLVARASLQVHRRALGALGL